MPRNDDDKQIDSLTQSGSKRRPGQHISDQERPLVQDNFLKTFALQGNVRQACFRAGISREMIYQWKLEDEAFAERYQQALDDVSDRIRAEMWRRAITGVKKPVYQGGKLVGHIQEYSDGLIALLAKAHMPEFRQVGVTAEEGRREYVGIPVEEV
jgi:hypothetical protein